MIIKLMHTLIFVFTKIYLKVLRILRVFLVTLQNDKRKNI